MLFGLDIASYQGYPDFVQLAEEGHSFCITKVTGEQHYVNPFWARNMASARAAGMVVGGYDWVECQSGDAPTAAAEDYLRVLGERQVGDLLTVDFETPEWHTGPLGRDIEAWMRTYLYTLRDKGGQPVIVYTAPYFLLETRALGWEWLGRDFLLWQAAPGQDAMLPDDARWPVTPLPWTSTLIHQHQWHATSDAVRGEFDRNRFRGTRAELFGYGLPGPKEAGEVQEPAAGKFTAYINARNEPIFVWNAGGQTPRIDGINVQDLGLSVESATEPGALLDISIQNNVVGVYHERKVQP